MASGTLKTVLSSNTQHLHTIINRYEAYKAEKLSKNQYGHARSKAITKLEANMGPLGRLFNRKRTYRQILRISRKKGRIPTHNITRQIRRMSKLSKFAAGGSILLAGLDLKLSCDAIGEANTSLAKNEIFAETLGGLTSGAIYGTAVAIIFAATPVGWVVALVLVAGSVAYGLLGKRAGRYVYDTSFRNVDLLSKTGVSHLCG